MDPAGPARQPPPLGVGDLLTALAAAWAGFGVVVVVATLVQRALGVPSAAVGSTGAAVVHSLALGAAAGAALAADARRRRGTARDRLGLVVVAPVALGLAFVAGVALQLPLAELANRVETVAPSPPAVRAALERLVRPGDPIGWVVSGLALVVVAPVAEELLFRGLLLRGLRPRVGPTGAALVSSGLFGALHGTPSAVTYATAAGLVLAALALRVGSVVPGIAVHAGVNAAPLLAVAGGWVVPGLTADSADPGAIPPALWLGATLLATGLLVAVDRLARRTA